MPGLPRLDYHLVNAFVTGSPHSGNQASVVIFPPNDPRAEDDNFLLTTAQDFAYAETAYLVPIDENKGRWGLRWFTIQSEVPICGHATLAASKVILSRYPDLAEIKFQTRFWGELTAVRRQDGAHDENSLEIIISLSTLSPPSLDKLVETSAQHLEVLGPQFADVLQIPREQILGVGEFQFNTQSFIVELAPEVDLGQMKLDYAGLTSIVPGMTIISQMKPDESSAGILRTHSRIAWECGEDPVTGSAHAFLTGYYLLTPASARIPPAVLDGRDVKTVALDGRQLSERGGKLYCELKEGGMVDISGRAAEWGTGSLTAW